MNGFQQMCLRLYIRELAEQENCKTAKDFEGFAEDIHELVEDTIERMCLENDIDDYSPSF